MSEPVPEELVRSIIDAINKRLTPTFSRINQELNELRDRVNQIEARVRSIQSDFIQTFTRSVIQVRLSELSQEFTNYIGSTLKDITQTLKTIQLDIQSLKSFLPDFEKYSGSLSKIIEDSVRSTLSELRLPEVNVESISKSISLRVNEVLQTSFSSFIKKVDNIVENLNKFVNDLNDVRKTIQTLTKRLDNIERRVEEVAQYVDVFEELRRVVEESRQRRGEEVQ